VFSQILFEWIQNPICGIPNPIWICPFEPIGNPAKEKKMKSGICFPISKEKKENVSGCYLQILNVTWIFNISTLMPCMFIQMGRLWIGIHI
jgi:hypothetical protein